jgi:hypothetical protein
LVSGVGETRHRFQTHRFFYLNQEPPVNLGPSGNNRPSSAEANRNAVAVFNPALTHSEAANRFQFVSVK